MKNQNKKIFLLVMACFTLYFGASVVFEIFRIRWKPFDRINLVSEIFPQKNTGENTAEPESQTVAAFPQTTEKETAAADFDLYKMPETITNLSAGNSIAALPEFCRKLESLKNGQPLKIRIAYFGDSMIEGDLMTKTLRKLLQQAYGGSGAGFVPLQSPSAGFRQTVNSSASGWEVTNFMTKNAQNMYISGYKFQGEGRGNYADNTIKDSVNIEKSILYGKTGGIVTANGQTFNLQNSDSWVNRQVVSDDFSNRIKIRSESGSMVLYGVSFESKTGIFMDNFSFRGITGVELKKIDEDFLKDLDRANHYDLIVFQYGVNLLFRPNDKDYSYYGKLITPVFQKMKKAFPDTEFLLIGSADRAFKYNGEWKTAAGLPNLLELQARLAMDNDFAFYNQFASMGGENSIVRWAQENPPLANKDYVHPNEKGTDILAQKLFGAIEKNLLKFEKNIKNGK